MGAIVAPRKQAKQISPTGEMDRVVASLLAMTALGSLIPNGVIASRRRSNPFGPVTWIVAMTALHPDSP
jgi:hypothetical protein